MRPFSFEYSGAIDAGSDLPCLKSGLVDKSSFNEYHVSAYIILGGLITGTKAILLNAENQAKRWIGVSLMDDGITVEILADLVAPIAKQPKQKSPTGQN
jgi:hypothetical protein